MGGSSVALVQPLSQPALSDPGGLIAKGLLIVVSAPALTAGCQLVRPGAVLLVSCRAGACGRLLLISLCCCLTELYFGLLWTSRTARGCLLVLPCLICQFPLDYRRTVPGFARSIPASHPTPLRPTPTPPTHRGPAHCTPDHAPPAGRAARATATVTSAAEASADAPALALVVQDCFIMTSAPVRLVSGSFPCQSIVIFMILESP